MHRSDKCVDINSKLQTDQSNILRFLFLYKTNLLAALHGCMYVYVMLISTSKYCIRFTNLQNKSTYA